MRDPNSVGAGIRNRAPDALFLAAGFPPSEDRAMLRGMELPADVRYWSLRRLLGTLVPAAMVDRLGTEDSLWLIARPGLAGDAALAALEPAARERLAAAFELGRRRARLRVDLARGIAGPRELIRLLQPLLEDEPVEVFLAAHFDARHRLLATTEIARGTLTGSLVHPREVFRSAVQAGASAIAVAHNHPSGSSDPSPEDEEVTRRLAESGRLLGIPLLDHVIVAAAGSRSLRMESPELFDGLCASASER